LRNLSRGRILANLSLVGFHHLSDDHLTGYAQPVMLGPAPSVGAVRLIASMLNGTRPLHPAIFAGVVAALLVVAALASLVRHGRPRESILCRHCELNSKDIGNSRNASIGTNSPNDHREQCTCFYNRQIGQMA